MKAKPEKMLRFYQQMVTIRRFEEAAAKAYSTRRIRGFCHLYIGEESVAVGFLGALESTDYVLATYREHGHALAKGMSPDVVMAELFGRSTGCSQGRGGSMHLFDREKRFFGGHGIVGGHVAVAAGVAFASAYEKKPDVTLCFLGEGAINIGGFHEGVSLAALWSLPIVFVIENNEYSMGTPAYRSQPVERLSEKAKAYGIPGITLDCADVMDVYKVASDAVARAREGKGPTLVEALTYRFRGHSMSDPAKYRSEAEVTEHKAKDPVLITRNALLSAGIPEATLEEIEKEALAASESSVQFAEQSPFPSESDLYTHIYAGDVHP